MKKWEVQIRKAPVQYSGTCPKCKEFVRGGDECPKKPQPNCPMRIPEEKPRQSRSAFLRDD